MTKGDFKIIALPTAVAEQARAAATSGSPGHAIVTVETPQSYPCRHCLRFASPGERIVLFTYAAIPSGYPYSESGPIVVHLDGCERYASSAEYPDELRHGRVMRAYNERFEIIDAEVVNGQTPEAVIEKLFANSATNFIDTRSVTRGCFTFRIARA